MKSTKLEVSLNGMHLDSPSKSILSICSIDIFPLKRCGDLWHDLSLGSLKLSRPELLQKLIEVRVWNSVWLNVYEKNEFAA